MENSPKEGKRIPVSVSLLPSLEAENVHQPDVPNKIRLLYMSSLAIVIAGLTACIAKVLVLLINLFTNLFFYGNFSAAATSPWYHHLGMWVILIPALGGVIIGIMAFYGSKAIRGHGIPEAMEQILTNESKIKPSITFLKPLSSAISIGTGGPFGAEGPIIATGGALGSSIGQLLKITANERKTLLAAGATAGMSAIFGSPVAAILLAIELLLFEFSPRSIIPVALACITGAAGHKLFFESKPVFEMATVAAVPNTALLMYSILGLAMGIVSALVTKAVYAIEDAFEKLPIHWMWWPALGGLAVGAVGYFAPQTMGVGYSNISILLLGKVSMQILLVLSLMKFISWSISLGSGTSGGTLAPLLTIGGAVGMLMGIALENIYPQSGITLPLCALVGMAGMFAGASRALMTSIVFAFETTGQANALLPLLAGCCASYFVSFFLLENTIMTEKIARRGVKTPISYEPDILEKLTVERVMQMEPFMLRFNSTLAEARSGLRITDAKKAPGHFIVVDEENAFRGTISLLDILNPNHNEKTLLSGLVRDKQIFIYDDNSLRVAVDIMARENLDLLPVVSREDKTAILGVLSYKDIIKAYKYRMKEQEHRRKELSLRGYPLRSTLKA